MDAEQVKRELYAVYCLLRQHLQRAALTPGEFGREMAKECLSYVAHDGTMTTDDLAQALVAVAQQECPPTPSPAETERDDNPAA